MKKKLDKAKATFSLNKTLVDKLQKTSIEEGIPMSTIVILALTDYFKRKEKRGA